jgi:hypothetical protein
MSIVYVVERVVKYEGHDVIAIFDSMEKANVCTREQGAKAERDHTKLREEVSDGGAVRVSVSDVHWTTIPWKVL